MGADHVFSPANDLPALDLPWLNIEHICQAGKRED